jgi:hypothetical protein
MGRLGVARGCAELRSSGRVLGPRRLDVFARGTRNTIFQRTFDANNWLDRTRVPDPSPELTVALPGIAAVAWPDTFELFTWVQSRHL